MGEPNRRLDHSIAFDSHISDFVVALGGPMGWSPLKLVTLAIGFVGLGEDDENPPGSLITTFLREVGAGPFEPWDTAFIHYVGYRSQYNAEVKESLWPLPRTDR